VARGGVEDRRQVDDARAEPLHVLELLGDAVEVAAEDLLAGRPRAGVPRGSALEARHVDE
jgi:hypothetical protein